MTSVDGRRRSCRVTAAAKARHGLCRGVGAGHHDLEHRRGERGCEQHRDWRAPGNVVDRFVRREEDLGGGQDRCDGSLRGACEHEHQSDTHAEHGDGVRRTVHVDGDGQCVLGVATGPGGERFVRWAGRPRGVGKVTLDNATVWARGDFSGGTTPCIAGPVRAAMAARSMCGRGTNASLAGTRGPWTCGPNAGCAAGRVDLADCVHDDHDQPDVERRVAVPSQTITTPPCPAGPPLPSYVEAAFKALGDKGDRDIWKACAPTPHEIVKSGIKFDDTDGSGTPPRVTPRSTAGRSTSSRAVWRSSVRRSRPVRRRSRPGPASMRSRCRHRPPRPACTWCARTRSRPPDSPATPRPIPTAARRVRYPVSTTSPVTARPA